MAGLRRGEIEINRSRYKIRTAGWELRRWWLSWTAAAAEPGRGEQRDGRRDGSQREQTVHGTRSNPLCRAQAGSAERPRGHALTGAPSADVRRHRRGKQHEHGKWNQLDGG